VFGGATLERVAGRFTDFSESIWNAARAPGASFERATFARARLDNLAASDAVFEFADLRDVRARGASFARSRFVGTCLQGAELTGCNLSDADLMWAEIDGLRISDCNTDGARFPQEEPVVYGPVRSRPPAVRPLPLHRAAATPDERRKLLQATPAPPNS
jgi:uncharacterized protein YjbI with pentapeptide repeats